MKVFYSEAHKQATIDYVNKNNPHGLNGEHLVNDLIVSSVKANPNVVSIGCGGVVVSISQERKSFGDNYENDIYLDFYVNPLIGGDYDYKEQEVKL